MPDRKKNSPEAKEAALRRVKLRREGRSEMKKLLAVIGKNKKELSKIRSYLNF